MSRKEKYSLTSKQRKKLREKNERADAAANTDDDVKTKNKKFITRVIAAVCACTVIIGAAITAILLILNIDEYDFTVAEITFEYDGKTADVRFQLFDGEDETPLTVGYFVYNAQAKFFNDTVISYHNGDYIKGGKYTEYTSSSNFRSNYAVKKFEEMKINIKTESNAKTSTNNKLINSFGYLSTSTSSSSGRANAEFRICLKDNVPSPTGNFAQYGTVFGRVMDDASSDILREIAEFGAQEESPYVPTETVKIKSVKIARSKKYRNYDFKKTYVENTDYFAYTGS